MKLENVRKNKAQIESTLVVIVIGLLVAIIIFSMLVEIIKSLKKSSDVEICRLSVLGRSVAIKATVVKSDVPINLDCKTRYVTIKPDGIYINEKRNKKDNFRRITDNDAQLKIKKLFAEEMRICWYQFLEGKQTTFGVFGSPNKCVICSMIEFSPEAQQQVKEIPGFGKYLMETTMPNTKVTYISYFTSDETASIQDIPLKTNITSAVAFVSEKPYYFFGGLLTLKNPLSQTLSIHLEDAKNLANYCDELK